MTEVIDFIKRATGKLQLTREMFSDSKVPTNYNDIKIITFFGDTRSEFVLSSLLVDRCKGSDYNIILSWPGHSGLYDSWAKEYWTITDENALGDLSRHVNLFKNSKGDIYEKMLLRYFDNVDTGYDLVSKYYDNGFTKSYFDKFDDFQFSLPSLPSVNMGWEGNPKMQNKKTIFLSPAKYIQRWGQGRAFSSLTSLGFWKELVKALIDANYMPVIMQNYGTYDLSPEFGSRCAYITEKNLLAVFGVMRACDCVLDVFSGLSRYAMVSRTPYFVCDERQRYFETRDYEIDDICGRKLPHKFIFSFSPLTASDSSPHLVENIINSLGNFVKGLDRRLLPSTVNSVQYLPKNLIRNRIIRRINNCYVPVPKNEDFN